MNLRGWIKNHLLPALIAGTLASGSVLSFLTLGVSATFDLLAEFWQEILISVALIWLGVDNIRLRRRLYYPASDLTQDHETVLLVYYYVSQNSPKLFLHHTVVAKFLDWNPQKADINHYDLLNRHYYLTPINGKDGISRINADGRNYVESMEGYKEHLLVLQERLNTAAEENRMMLTVPDKDS